MFKITDAKATTGLVAIRLFVVFLSFLVGFVQSFVGVTDV